MFDSRTPPLYFAGREAELSRLRARLAAFVADGPSAAQGGLELVLGVPGSGKSALLDRFAELAAPDADVMRAQPSQLSNGPKSFFLNLAKAARMTTIGQRIAEAEPRTTGFQMKLPWLGGGRNVERERVAHDIATMLERLGEKWVGSKPLIVLADELQQIDEGAKPVMQALHAGLHGCPIMVVGAGLEHVPQAMANLGISRTKQPMALHSLSVDETRSAIVENAARGAGVEDVPESVLARLIERSQCFPVHIQGYLEGIAQAVDAKGVDALNDDAAAGRAIEYGDWLRERYYNDRLNMMDLGGPSRSARNALRPITAALMEKDTLDVDEAAALCDNPPSVDGHRVVDQAVHHGVLRLRDGTVDYGIPSFHQHMVGLLRAGDREPRRGIAR